MRWYRLVCFNFLLYLLYSCAPQLSRNVMPVGHTFLKNYQSFRICSLEEGRLPNGMDIFTFEIISTVIKKEMLKRGYVESEAPELFINIGMTQIINPRTTESLPQGAYPAFIVPRINYINTYSHTLSRIEEIQEPGQVVLDIVDLNKQIHLFSLVSKSLLDPNSGLFVSPYSISKAIRDLFIQLDP